MLHAGTRKTLVLAVLSFAFATSTAFSRDDIRTEPPVHLR